MPEGATPLPKQEARPLTGLAAIDLTAAAAVSRGGSGRFEEYTLGDDGLPPREVEMQTASVTPPADTEAGTPVIPSPSSADVPANEEAVKVVKVKRKKGSKKKSTVA
jgi:hypothetical protein